jgi:hypothetical protein
MLYRGKLQYFAKNHSPLAHLLLLAAIWSATLSKLIAYKLLKVINRSNRRKEAFWRGVVQGLVKT